MDKNGSALLDSWLGGWSAAVAGMAQSFTHLSGAESTAAVSAFPATLPGATVWPRFPLETGSPLSPTALLSRVLDLPRWWQLTTDRRRPAWSTPHEVVFEAPIARLRDFSTRRPAGLMPTLVLPPQAGHDSCIVDYSPEQSQMRTIVEAGLEHALSLDWIGATHETADSTIEDYLDVVDRAVEHCGGKVNLIGDCQGGWLATMYAALAPERVNTLTIAGAPIDFHAGDPVIHETVRMLAPGGDLRFYEGLVAAGGGLFRGRHMLTGFIMIQPSDEISRQLELLLHLDEPAYVERYRAFEDWFKHTQDIPGSFYLWIVRNLFVENLLVQGGIEIDGAAVDLRRLEMPLNLLAGAGDHITPPDQVFALADVASTSPELIRRSITSGGHLGLFMGREALREHWPPMLAEVLAHSAAS
ncbi:MAG: alpha/beta hydrolase [Solirubrobacterales bacterium]|nr:alpha/beta hydrolase [Solirubrobacterales bacterium]